jgi:NOL1/NOP2/sun family putative RNA methylase
MSIDTSVGDRYTPPAMTLEVPAAFAERYFQLVDDAPAFFEAMLTPLPKSFRINTLKATAETVAPRFAEYGIGIKQTAWYSDAFVSDNPALGSTLEHFLGAIYIQELTSMLPPLLVRTELHTATTVLDACAAPGSKTTQLSALMNNRGTIVANDVEYERIKPLKFNLERSGTLNAVVTNYDLRSFPQMLFDVALLDAPCTSEGIFRKNPRQMMSWSPRRIAPSAFRQKQLILKTFDLLADGGTLIYSTCTFAPEENEAVIDYLLKERPAELEQVDIPNFRLMPGITAWQNQTFDERVHMTARVLPHHNDTGGFFLARIKR